MAGVKNSTKKLSEEAKEALQISELKYRRLFETAQDGVLIVDAQTGNVQDANSSLLKLLGYSKKEIIGKKLWEIEAFFDIRTAKNIFQTLISVPT